MITLSFISLQAVILRMGDTYDHISSCIEFYKILAKVRIFFRQLPFSELLLMSNQSGKWTSKVSTMLQKTAQVEYGTKTCQNQNHDPFT